MFSFHKPKVYRSTTGCCICKAKSSSSRFTDSIKYEDDLIECFKLAEKRTGEICNACVLLVKRWKKLPVGSNRHWRHVVDQRAGPGSKGLGRSKTRNKKRPKLKAETRAASPGADDGDELSCDLSVLSVLSGPSSPTEPAVVVAAPVLPASSKSRKRFRQPEHRRDIEPTSSGLVDLSFWKRKKVCCGVIFVGPCGIIMIDPRLLKPTCNGKCEANMQSSPPTDEPVAEDVASSPARSSPTCEERASSPPRSDIATHGGSTPCTTISDSSSDSGYDDCSNPAAAGAPAN